VLNKLAKEINNHQLEYLFLALTLLSFKIKAFHDVYKELHHLGETTAEKFVKKLLIFSISVSFLHQLNS
jgi:hypothetical protein